MSMSTESWQLQGRATKPEATYSSAGLSSSPSAPMLPVRLLAFRRLGLSGTRSGVLVGDGVEVGAQAVRVELRRGGESIEQDLGTHGDRVGPSEDATA